jgi:hypothetical protein
MILSALAIALSLQAQAMQPVIAVTKSGVHIEALDCQVGDLQLATPFGLYLCASDPVVEVRDLILSSQPLAKLREDGVFTNEEWLAAISRAGLLTLLLDQTSLIAGSFPKVIDGYNLIQYWAAQTSNLDPAINLDDRISKLYKMYLRQQGLRRLILGTELENIVSASSNKRAERNLSYMQIGDELKSTDPIRRRIGLQIATKQSEVVYLHQILAMTIVDSTAQVRQTAALSCSALHQHAARQYWVKLAARGSELHRGYAVNYLAHYSGPIGIRALKMLDSASEHRIGDRYSFSSNKIWVVQASDSSLVRPVLWLNNSPSERSNLHLFDHLSDNTEFIDSRSVFVVTKVPPLLAEQIRALL